ncbi:MAG: hypothetical protein II455_06055 [Paludibacteraceae bacterium]|nr:hypothetical protein [Paludibacteraceae bacterium]MBQ2065614.1 hypothetical protein [Paludibacteraceae bacterium]
MKVFVKIAVVVAVLAGAVLASCTSECYQSKRSLLGVTFLDSLTMKPLTVQRLTVKGVGSDSILYNNVNVNTVFLPMHLTADLTEYEFTILPPTEDQVVISFILSVKHNVRPFFVSKECGCVASYEIRDMSYTPNVFIKKAEIYNPSVLNVEGDVHIKIYSY